MRYVEFKVLKDRFKSLEIDGSHLKGNFKGNRRIYSCPAMVDKVLKDNYKTGNLVDSPHT